MKLKKRIMACVVAAAVVVTSAVTAMAAGSIDKTGKADGYKVRYNYTYLPGNFQNLHSSSGRSC